VLWPSFCVAPEIDGPANGTSCAHWPAMATDHRKLTAFTLADELVLKIYRTTRDFPAAERYGLQAQIRRSAVSIPTNIVEGCARSSNREHDRFFEMAFSSTREVIYLIDLSARLKILDAAVAQDLVTFAGRIAAALAALRKSIPP
jgi:four helix bundle protein